MFSSNAISRAFSVEADMVQNSLIELYPMGWIGQVQNAFKATVVERLTIPMISQPFECRYSVVRELAWSVNTLIKGGGKFPKYS
jgi:hypothetical protein